jgi:5-methylcytosine-specific restriction endonuclease McrA
LYSCFPGLTRYTTDCSDCDESLCSDCFSVHGTFKAFISHQVIDSQVSADISFELNKFCSDHKDMEYSLYSCFPGLTRYTTVYWMSEWASNIVWCQISNFSGWQDWNNIADIYFELNKFCFDHKDMVLDFYCSDHDDISCKSCIADEHRINVFQNSRSKYFYASLYAICTRIPRDFTFLLLFSSLTSSIDQIFEKQIFRLMKTLETGLSQKSEDLEKLISSLTFPQLVFKESNVLSKMETIYQTNSFLC